jgi:hypothetical protein
MSEHLKYPFGKRVLLFLIILAISSLIGAAIAALFMLAGDTGMRLAQGFSSIMMFVVPPIVFYYLTRKEDQLEALGLRSPAEPTWIILIGVVLMFVSLPVTNQLARWNENTSLFSTFEKLEDYLRELEDMAAATTERMLNVKTFGGLLLNLLVIALIPAIGEELTFRGVLQQGLARKMNPHLAIVISAAIFSFIHFQFFGFLPRMFLGLLLGYMFYITGSLWTSILMHFVNNATAVVVYYLNHKGTINVDAEHFGEASHSWMVTISLVVTMLLVLWSWWQIDYVKKGNNI